MRSQLVDKHGIDPAGLDAHGLGKRQPVAATPVPTARMTPPGARKTGKWKWWSRAFGAEGGDALGTPGGARTGRETPPRL